MLTARMTARIPSAIRRVSVWFVEYGSEGGGAVAAPIAIGGRRGGSTSKPCGSGRISTSASRISLSLL